MSGVFVFLLLICVGLGIAAYDGSFYVTGTQFYESCWEKNANAKALNYSKEPEPRDPYQAAVWAQCNDIAARAMDSENMVLSSSSPSAPAEARALSSFCPDRET